MATKNGKKNGSGSQKFYNFFKATLRIGTEPEVRYSAAGNPWAKARASLSMGKTDDGSYKPSLWLTAKVFGREDNAATTGLVEQFGELAKGQLVTLSGRLAYEEYETKEGERRSDLSLIVTRIEPVPAKAAEAAEAAEPVAGEVAEAEAELDPPA